MEEENKILNIAPLKKGKRILLFLGDFFIMFILSFVFLGVLVVPLGTKITKLQEKAEQEVIAENNCLEILYGNKLLHYTSEADKYNMSSSLDFSSICYLSYYVFNEENPSITNISQYGHKMENEVLLTYYRDIRNNVVTYKESLLRYDSAYQYFTSSGGAVSLKDSIKEQLVPYFDSRDTLSENGEIIFANITENIFLNLYSDMVKDIKAKDLVFNDKSFITEKKIVEDYENYHDTFFSIATLISYFLSLIAVYLVFPMVNKYHKTPTMMIMKIDRIGVNTLYVLQRKEIIFNFVYQMVLNLFFVILLPLSYVPITYLFMLPYLPTLSFIGLGTTLISLVFVFINQHNRSLSDIFSRSVLILSADLDRIYQTKGYKI